MFSNQVFNSKTRKNIFILMHYCSVKYNGSFQNISSILSIVWARGDLKYMYLLNIWVKRKTNSEVFWKNYHSSDISIHVFLTIHEKPRFVYFFMAQHIFDVELIAIQLMCILGISPYMLNKCIEHHMSLSCVEYVLNPYMYV